MRLDQTAGPFGKAGDAPAALGCSGSTEVAEALRGRRHKRRMRIRARLLMRAVMKWEIAK